MAAVIESPTISILRVAGAAVGFAVGARGGGGTKVPSDSNETTVVTPVPYCGETMFSSVTEVEPVPAHSTVVPGLVATVGAQN